MGERWKAPGDWSRPERCEPAGGCPRRQPSGESARHSERQRGDAPCDGYAGRMATDARGGAGGGPGGRPGRARPRRSRCFASCRRPTSRSSTRSGRPTTSPSNHGYMIYDVLFAPNAKLEYKPQMVDTYSKSADGLIWRFKLRDGLQFSDGSPVQAKDAVASLKRWGDRVPVGKTLLPVHQGGGGHRAAHVRDPARQALRPGPRGPGHAGEPALHPPGEGSPDPVRQADHRGRSAPAPS